MSKLSVGILGATGAVGQRFIQLLEGHPWFEVTHLAASERSAGKAYREAAKWRLPTPIPDGIADMEVVNTDPSSVDAAIVFSALPADHAASVEPAFAGAGSFVCSNTRTMRMVEDVPLIIPEVNPEHLALLEIQRRNRKWDGGIVTNPNCSTIMMVLSLAPLLPLGLKDVKVATLQAISGAGYDGLPSMAILGNVVPYIGEEEEKMESETMKLLGSLEGDRIVPSTIGISACCHRVPVTDGHTMSIWCEFEADVKPQMMRKAMMDFNPDLGDLPSRPRRCIIVRDEPDRPQPLLDRDAENGMAISVGRIREGGRFVCMGHNTVRGAAGASILNAEFMHSKKLF